MDKQSVLALGAAAGLGVGYFLGRSQSTTTSSKTPVTKTAAKQQSPIANESEDEVERLIRPNILALTPYRCARDDYDQGAVPAKAILNLYKQAV